MIKKWLKDKLGISKLEERIISLHSEVRYLQEELDHQSKYITSKVAELKEYTRVDADVGMRGNNTIILTGVYHKQAYVHFYDMGDGEFERLVNQLRDMKDHALIRNIDSPPNFHGMFNL